ncbi:MAG: putative nucleic acid-binding protein [Cyclobacteriaceae bacterium]
MYKLEILNPQLVELPESASTNVSRDPKDEKFLTLASLYNPNGMVSGDEDLLIHNPFNAIPILTPL